MTQEEKQLKTQELDIPEFLKGQTKEYIRIEKNSFNQARYMAYMRGITTGVCLTMIIGLLIVLIIVGVQHFSFGTLPMAGP